ncbi:MAG: hypothetical protein WCW03_02770 [Candidatus Paceibacterota bacterium]
MYVLISIFYISLIAMIIMIWRKSHELKTGKRTVVSMIGQSTDSLFNSIYDKFKSLASYINRHTFIALANWFAFHILLHIRKVYVEIKHQFMMNPHGKRLIDAVRGRGEIKNHGASLYLRRIANDK